MMRTFMRYEPGGGLGCADADCGLGALLPVVSYDAATAAAAAQYAALASGKAVGGNFERFKDAAALGWFTDDAAGYTNYLAVNSKGMADPLYDNNPDFAGWQIAANMAYAVANKMHVGNALSPVYDPVTAQQTGLKSILGMTSNHRWTDAQRTVAEDSFAEHFPRLLKLFGYTGAVPSVTVPVMVKNPFFESQGKTVWVDKATITYDGPDRDPAVAALGGREFSAGGVTWRWGASAAAAPPPIKMAELVLSKAKSPGDGIHFAVVGWRLQDIDPRSRVAVRSMGWNRWDGLVNKLSSETTKSSFIEDIDDEVQRHLSFGDTRPDQYWQYAELKRVLGLPGPGSPPPTNVGIDTLAAPTSTSLAPVTLPTGTQQSKPPVVAPPVPSGTGPPTTKPWTDIAVPPQPPSSGSQPVIPPGVPPVETVTGALVPSIVASGGGVLTPTGDVPDDESSRAGYDAMSIGQGTGLAILAGVGLLFLLGRKRRR